MRRKARCRNLVATGLGRRTENETLSCGSDQFHQNKKIAQKTLKAGAALATDRELNINPKGNHSGAADDHQN